MQTFVPLQRVKLLSFVLAVLLFVVGVVAASAQPVRIAVGGRVSLHCRLGWLKMVATSRARVYPPN